MLISCFNVRNASQTSRLLPRDVCWRLAQRAVLFWTAVACSGAVPSHPAESATEASPASRGVSRNNPLISVEFEAQTRAAPQQTLHLTPGAQLHSGDYLWANIHIIRACHIYVVALAETDAAELLYPRDTELDLLNESGVTLRVPPVGDLFMLDNQPGRDRLVVVASTDSIKFTDTVLARWIQEVSAQAPKQQHHPASSGQASIPTTGYHLRIAERGIVRVRASAVEAQEAADGVAVVVFDVLHL